MDERGTEGQRSEPGHQAGLTFEVILTRWMRGIYLLQDAVDRLLGLELDDAERTVLANKHPWLYGAYSYARTVQIRGGDLKLPKHRG